jgi:aspartyl-tRNA(Asn)/glutamyl-tRNA(Gln) amidotransferase subunit C
MTIDRETVQHVAKLARLALTDEEEERFAQQLGQILGYVEQLEQLDTEGLEPTSHSIPLHNVLRADTRRQSLPHEDLLAGAPQAEQGMFRVPKIL